MISGSSFLGGPFDQPCQLLADDRAHAPHDERRIGHAERHAAGTDHAAADDGRVAQAGPVLFGLQSVGIRFLVGEAQRIGRLKVGVPFLERPVVEHLRRFVRRHDIPVIIAFGQTPKPLLGFLAVDRRLAAGAELPKPFRHAPFVPLRALRTRLTDGGFYLTGCHGGGAVGGG